MLCVLASPAKKTCCSGDLHFALPTSFMVADKYFWSAWDVELMPFHGREVLIDGCDNKDVKFFTLQLNYLHT